MSSARSVAKELVHLSMSGLVPDPLTYYRLQSLLYYAQAWSLVLRDSELFPDDIECSGEGPVVSAILDPRDENPPWQVVRPTSFDQEPNLDEEDEAVFLRHLLAAYGFLSSSELVTSIQEEVPLLVAKKERELGGKGLLEMNELGEFFSHRNAMPVALDEYRRLRAEREKEAELAIQNNPPLSVDAIWTKCSRNEYNPQWPTTPGGPTHEHCAGRFSTESKTTRIETPWRPRKEDRL